MAPTQASLDEAQRRWSLRTLVMSGFAVATLALLGAIGYAILSIEHLARESERLVESGVYTTRLIDQLQEQIPDLERTARQYRIVQSEELAEVYRRRHARFLEVLSALEAYAWAPEIDRVLAELRERADALVTQVTSNPDALNVEDYSQIQALAGRVIEASQRTSEAALENMHADVGQVRTALLALAVLLMAAVVVFAISFTRLVSRPIDQIGAGIRGLGQAHFDTPIAVRGPSDLAALGRLLDWLRERLRDLEEQKITFVRHMSHELKTPLANIREGSELLLDDLDQGDDAARRELAIIVRDNSVRLQKLIDDLFDFAAWHDDHSQFYPEAFELTAIVNEVVADHRLEMNARRIHIETTLPSSTTMTGDRRRVKSMLDNVVSNAVKYSPPGGAIHIDIELVDSEIQIDVRDQGPGIPPAEREKVFLPFFQGKLPVEARVPGTGIGLSVARACADAHGGRIAIVDDDKPGAHFHIRLPRQTTAHAN